MAFLSRRLFSTTTSTHPSASTACSELLSRFKNRPISTRNQLLDANQLHLLSTTLHRSPTSSNPPPQGTPIPPGYHLVYFTPSIAETDLGPDGTDRTVSPVAPFTRRMWAGGELVWTQDARRVLRVGQTVREVTKLVSAEAKRSKDGGEMLVVGVEKAFENEAGVALVDRRSWVFRQELTPGKHVAVASKPAEMALPEGKYSRDFCQTATGLFRFSALTFNGHKIHYSQEWCREVEGHRNAVVHGPLNLIHMLDFWRDTARAGDAEAVPKSISYRAMNPLYVGEPYRILLDRARSGDTEGDEWTTEIWDSFGKKSMKGMIME